VREAAHRSPFETALKNVGFVDIAITVDALIARTSTRATAGQREATRQLSTPIPQLRESQRG
jgi:hypothetical protein